MCGRSEACFTLDASPLEEIFAQDGMDRLCMNEILCKGGGAREASGGDHHAFHLDHAFS